MTTTTTHGSQLADRAQIERDNGDFMDREAHAALTAGDYDLALYLTDAAEHWLPGDPARWEKRRELIHEAMGEAGA